MPVFKYLDLSTAHITEKDSHLLDRMAQYPDHPLELRFETRLIIRKHPYGMWIHVPVGPEAEEQLVAIEKALAEAGFSPALMMILVYAMAKECFWINLDQDADEEVGLPRYPWGAVIKRKET